MCDRRSRATVKPNCLFSGLEAPSHRLVGGTPLVVPKTTRVRSYVGLNLDQKFSLACDKASTELFPEWDKHTRLINVSHEEEVVANVHSCCKRPG